MARAKRELLLRVHRHRLRKEDLEDCLSQATVELLAQARQGKRFASAAHVANALEQRFLSRVQDRRRALSGRSPIQAALETALTLDCPASQQVAVIDVRCEPEELAILRQELVHLTALMRQLTADQRLVLASQVFQIECRDFCRHNGWSAEKYRKVAQRARARLRTLMEREELVVPPGAPVSEQHAGTPYEPTSPHS